MRVFALRFLDPHDLLPSERTTYSHVPLRVLRALPVVAVRYDGAYVLIDGHHRHRSALSLGIPLPAVVLSLDYYLSRVRVLSPYGYTHHDVLHAALSRHPLPPKSTFHYVVSRGRLVHISSLARRVYHVMHPYKHPYLSIHDAGIQSTLP